MVTATCSYYDINKVRMFFDFKGDGPELNVINLDLFGFRMPWSEITLSSNLLIVYKSRTCDGP